MTDILSKVQLYLDKVAKEPVKISDKMVEEFGEACKSALRKQFSEERRKEFKPRMSNICLLYTSPSPRDRTRSRMPSSA